MTSLATIPDEDRRPIDWTAIESALHDMVDELLGIPFIFENQNLPQPPYPYASGLISAITPEGGDTEVRHQYNSSAPTGEQIEIFYCGTFEFTFSVSVHVDPASGAYSPRKDAKLLGSKLQWGGNKQAVTTLLQAAEVAIIEELALVDSSVVVNGEWLSRYTWDVRMRSVAVEVDTTTWIEKVAVDGTFPNAPSHDFSKVYDSTT